MTFPDGWIELPPCATEDSADCHWDASVQGNSQGHSFFDYAGQTVEITDKPGYHVDQVWVDPLTFDPQNMVGHLTILQQNAPSASPTPAPVPTTVQVAMPADPSTISAPDLAGGSLIVVAAFIVALVALATLPLFRKKAS